MESNIISIKTCYFITNYITEKEVFLQGKKVLGEDLGLWCLTPLSTIF